MKKVSHVWKMYFREDSENYRMFAIAKVILQNLSLLFEILPQNSHFLHFAQISIDTSPRWSHFGPKSANSTFCSKSLFGTKSAFPAQNALLAHKVVFG